MARKQPYTIISGGQTGVDQAALYVAKICGLKTGGMMPRGFRTLEGRRPDFAEKFGIKEHIKMTYPPRTAWNVRKSDATIRIATDFSTAGELCTLNAIKRHQKAFQDIDIDHPPDPLTVAKWILDNNFRTINIAGNSENTSPGISAKARAFLYLVFTELAISRRK